MTLKTTIAIAITAANIFLSANITRADNCTRYKVTTFTAKNGAPSNTTNVIDTDELRRIWLATDNGIICYANYTIATYRSTESNLQFFKSNDVLDIAIAKDTIWMVTSYGLEYFNFLTRSAGQIDDPQINYKGLYKICVMGNGRILLGGRDQLLLVGKSGSEIKDLSDLGDGRRIHGIKDIISDSNGNVWITAKKAPLYFLGSGSDKLAECPEKDIQDGAPSILSDKAENPLVISTWNNDILIIDGSKPSSIIRCRLDNEYGRVNCAEMDDEGNVWIATDRGILRMSPSGEISNALESTDIDNDWKKGRYLSAKYVGEGTVCLSCEGKGILLLKRMRQEVKTYSPASSGSINSTSNAIAEDWNGLLWIGTEGGRVSFFDKDRERFVQGPSSLMKASMIFAVDDLCSIPEEKRMFMATRESGIWEYEEGKPLKQYMLSEECLSGCLEIDGEKDVWVGTDRGIFILFRSNGGYRVIEPASFNKTMMFPNVSGLTFEGSSRVWIATRDKGVFSARHDGKSFSDIKHYCIENDNLISNNVNCVHINENGTVFIGTHYSGLLYYDPSNDNFVSVGENNMVRESISSIVEDVSGVLWISTINGFLSYSPKAQGSKLKKYSNDYFDKNYSFIPNSAWTDGSTVIFGGYGGISQFRISDIREKHVLQAPMIVGIGINNVYLADIPEKRRTKITAKFPPFTNNMLLRHNENKIRFNFANIYYDMTQNPKYSYKLSGVDNDWKYTDAREGYTSYDNLAPGTYLFSIRVQEPDNSWSKATTVDVTVMKPWWRRTWAIVIYLVAFAGIIILVVRDRNNKRHVATLMKEVDQLVTDKNRIIRFFSSHDDSESDMDRQMIDKIVTLIQANISNSDFNVETLQSEMSMSASTLYRKVKTLTGMSPSKFIQNVRMKQACTLLITKIGSVSEVAYKVGFTDPKYFSSNFKKEFGMTPSEYRNKVSGQAENQRERITSNN